MRLKTFLIIIGLWIALLPHVGFSLAAENVLFSITGFVCIVASFYVAALEDKHRHNRVIHEKNLSDVSQKISKKLQYLTKSKKVTSNESQTTQQNSDLQPNQEEVQQEQFENVSNEDESRPRIRKAISDVKINMDSVDDIVS